jgi:hypothetical protein
LEGGEKDGNDAQGLFEKRGRFGNS